MNMKAVMFFFIADYETQTELAVSTDINGE